MTKEDLRQQKAKALRYKKPMMQYMSLDYINQSIWDMQEAISDVQWFVGDRESLTEALCGDEDEAYEFQAAFSDLAAELEFFENDLRDAWVPKCFDELFPATDTGCFGAMLGYDSFEGDYVGLTPYEYQLGKEEAGKHICRLTKNELLEAVGACLKIYAQFTALQYRYDCLSASLDIVREKNLERLKLIKAIEEQYEKAEEDSSGFRYPWANEAMKFDGMLWQVPQEYWIQ